MNRKIRLLLLFPLVTLLPSLAQDAGKTAGEAKPATQKTGQERLWDPAPARLLVIHAEDLGMNHSVNRAIFEALENRWVTSASILVPCPWFPEVVKWAKEHPDADVGIHQDLNSEWTGLRWGPVSSKDQVPTLLDSDGYPPLETPALPQNAKIT